MSLCETNCSPGSASSVVSTSARLLYWLPAGLLSVSAVVIMWERPRIIITTPSLGRPDISEIFIGLVRSHPEWSSRIGPDPSRDLALIAWDMVLFSYASSNLPKDYFVPFAESLWHKGGFHAGKGSIIGTGVNNIIIQPIRDFFCACPPIPIIVLSI